MTRVLATATIKGQEARGQAQLVQAPGGTVSLEVDEFWVAPGAPDVRLYISSSADGEVDESTEDLGPVPDNTAVLSRQIPTDFDLADARSIVVYCRVYSVLFGYGTLAP
jgi:hypothetical protein